MAMIRPAAVAIKGASLPPPGIYLRDYNYFYYADRVNDYDGNKVGAADPEAFVYANVPRLVWITDLQLFGGSIGVDALLPLQCTDLSLNTPFGRYSDSTFGIGDAFAEVTWSTHLSKFDFSLGYGAWMPTGESDEPVDAGRGYWTHMFTAGATWYPDAAKKWAVSALNRYEISQDDEPGYAGQPRRGRLAGRVGGSGVGSRLSVLPACLPIGEASCPEVLGRRHLDLDDVLIDS